LASLFGVVRVPELTCPLPPRVRRHRYNGVLVPNSSLRAVVTAMVTPAATVAQVRASFERPLSRLLWPLRVDRHVSNGSKELVRSASGNGRNQSQTVGQSASGNDNRWPDCDLQAAVPAPPVAGHSKTRRCKFSFSGGRRRPPWATVRLQHSLSQSVLILPADEDAKKPSSVMHYPNPRIGV